MLVVIFVINNTLYTFLQNLLGFNFKLQINNYDISK